MSVEKNSPWISLIILLGLTLLLSVSTQIITFLLFLLASPGEMVSKLSDPQSLFASGNPALLYTLLAVSSLGTFLLPALFLQRIERKQYDYFPMQKRNLKWHLILIFAFLLVCNPVMELISNLNMSMRLPESFQGIEAWMRSQEDQMAQLTEKLVMVDSISFLLLNLLVMAILPAIVEEFFFRGALQKILQRMFKNGHVAIWVTAIIFSAIHVQFYGFFPRMLLGLVFGYSFWWTKNIWVPVFGHFLNNASVTIIAFYYHRSGKSFEDLQSSSAYSIGFYIISFMLTLTIGYYFYTFTHQSKTIHEPKLD